MGILDSVHQESFSTLTFWLKSILNSLVLQQNSSCFQEHTWKSTKFNHFTQLDTHPKKGMTLKLEVHKCPAGPSFSLTLHLTNKRRRLRTEELLKHLLKWLTFTGHLDPPSSSSPKNSTSSLTTRPFKGKTTTWWNLNQKKLQVGETSGITQKANRGFFQTLQKKPLTHQLEFTNKK